MVSEEETILRVRRETLLEGLEDWIGIWEIASGMDEIRDSARRKEAVLGMIRDFFDRGWVEAGVPTMDPVGFNAWKASTSEVLARIDREWLELGGDPSVGDIVWFNLTEKGKQEARRIADTTDVSTS